MNKRLAECCGVAPGWNPTYHSALVCPQCGLIVGSLNTPESAREHWNRVASAAAENERLKAAIGRLTGAEGSSE